MPFAGVERWVFVCVLVLLPVFAKLLALALEELPVGLIGVVGETGGTGLGGAFLEKFLRTRPGELTRDIGPARIWSFAVADRTSNEAG